MTTTSPQQLPKITLTSEGEVPKEPTVIEQISTWAFLNRHRLLTSVIDPNWMPESRALRHYLHQNPTLGAIVMCYVVEKITQGATTL